MASRVCWRGSALRGPTRQQSEALVEPTAEVYRVTSKPGRAAASSIARGMPSRRRQTDAARCASSPRRGQRSSRAAPSQGNEELNGIGAGDVNGAGDRPQEEATATELGRRSSSSTPRGSREVASKCHLRALTSVSDRRQPQPRLEEVLAVVEHDAEWTDPGAPRRSTHQSAEWAASGGSCSPSSASAIARGTLDGSLSKRELDEPDAFSAIAQHLWRTTSRARRVLPEPPAPVSVTSGAVRRRGPTTSASSLRRIQRTG